MMKSLLKISVYFLAVITVFVFEIFFLSLPKPFSTVLLPIAVAAVFLPRRPDFAVFVLVGSGLLWEFYSAAPFFALFFSSVSAALFGRLTARFLVHAETVLGRVILSLIMSIFFWFALGLIRYSFGEEVFGFDYISSTALLSVSFTTVFSFVLALFFRHKVERKRFGFFS